MSISSSMNAGLSGLSAHATKLATISDNISNSQTYGYKRADADFASIAIGESRGSYTAGGVRTTTIRDVEARGSLVGSKNATDLAISGRGMLPVTSLASAKAGVTPPQLMLTSTGSFEPDENGVLRTPSGLVLLGWPADPQGEIPEPPRNSAAALRPVALNRSAVAAEPTTRIELGANLPASATARDADLMAEFPISLEYFDTLGASQTMDFTFRPVSDGGAPAAPVPNRWALQIGDRVSGTMLGSFEIEFDDQVGTGGAIRAVTRTGGAAAYDGASGVVTLNLAGGQEIEVRMGAENGQAPQALSQLASVFSPVGVTKNGSGAGSFTGVTVDESGFLYANYSSGFSKLVYQIPVADVPNMDGLRALDNQAFAVSTASGPVYFWDAGDGPAGGVMGFAREQSTTDIGAELTQMIQTQRAYSSNAKIIQTVDEMLQETTNLKR